MAFFRNLVACAGCCLGVVGGFEGRAEDHGPQRAGLAEELTSESASQLAKAAREKGDPVRGALLFYQQQLACAKCHSTGEAGARLGPDLASVGEEAGDVYLVESLLSPSKAIRKGYETTTVVTDEGRVVTGLVSQESPDELLLRDVAQEGMLIAVAKSTIEERIDGRVSLMPEGLPAQLSDRQQFLDLVRYLIEIAEQGPARAEELRPPQSLYAPPPLAEYEHQIDHAGMIASFDAETFRRGEAIYNRVCANCHGTHERPGSLPISLRFAEGSFKAGSDPFGMYQTLTRGYGLMAPQVWMVPQQKYDVIHYVREAYLRDHNPTQYTRIDDRYLQRLPPGTTRGPEPSTIEPWETMDYGPTLAGTYEAGESGNFAYKGIAVRLDAGPGGVAQGRHWMLYDQDTLRAAAAWSGRGFIDWEGIQFNGKHEAHPRLAGETRVATGMGPGWAEPGTGSFEDHRLQGRDGLRYGPLPRRWAHYKGLYHFGHQAILSYTVGETEVLECPGYEIDSAEPEAVVFSRTVSMGPSSDDLVMRVAQAGTAVALVGGASATLMEDDGSVLLTIPAAATPLSLKVLMSDGEQQRLQSYASTSPPPQSLAYMTHGGPKRWPEVLRTRAVVGASDGAFAVDVLAHPQQNPWSCQVRPTGLDFLPDGKRMALCTWDGDVWLVEGFYQGEREAAEAVDERPAGDQEPVELTWRRIASGLFQPLGLKVIDGLIYVACRDQIAILRDLNGDGETDFYECFNNDHQVTEHFHEFAMGLQTDAAGNLYYAKSARHAKQALVPHHGTLLRVSPDGSRTDIVATGFRAANGVCVNPDGSFFVTDQEGHWNPKNRINWVVEGGFYGNMWGYHDVTDSSDAAMQQPLCWITNSFDRSPAELLWATTSRWGPLEGALLNLSYGQGRIYIVPHEKVNGQMQGGMCPLPLPLFPTGIMRGRFHAGDGQLYACGMFSWAGNQQQPGGLYRIRYTGRPVHLPVELCARRRGMAIRFSGRLDALSAASAENYSVKTWSLKRSSEYGSEHYDEKQIEVAGATLSEDGQTVFLEIPEIQPTWCMEIDYALRAESGSVVNGAIHNTIHCLAD